MSDHENLDHIVPLKVLRDRDLEAGATLLYAHLFTFDKKGICKPSTTQLAKDHNVSESTIQKWLVSLQVRGHLGKIHYDDEVIVEYLKNKIPQKISNEFLRYFKTCEWCRCKTLTLQNHHYPIPKRDAGKEIVRICANCHQEFHFLSDHNKFTFLSGVDHE